MGLSLEFWAIERYAGTNPRAIDPVFEQLIRNLAPGQAPVIRIGGDTTDWTWWPVPHLRRPLGIRYELTERWLQVTRALAAAVRAHLILGVNMEAASRALAGAEAHAFLTRIGRPWVAFLEPGNEPALYSTFPWYTIHGQHVRGRPRGYDYRAFAQEFSRLVGALPRVPIAGPTTGGPEYMSSLSRFIESNPRLGLVTVHRYPLERCHLVPGSPRTPTIPQLLSAAAANTLSASVAPYAAIANAHGVPLRLDELNSVACSGARHVSDVFASALWSLDALFRMAAAGAAGVNIHTFPRARYAPFTLHRTSGGWRAFVTPEYYGLMMFAQAAPPGSRLVRSTGATPAGIRSWVTRGPGGKTRVVLINDSAGATRTLALRISAAAGPATLVRLQAPGLAAGRGVTLGGQSFGSQTSTGRLSGPPQLSSVTSLPGLGYLVSLPPASAAMVTVG